MLYATTRGNIEIVTAYQAIHRDCAADGGLFVPFRLPQYSYAQIAAMAECSYGENVAQILNELFQLRLTGWNVDIVMGRYPVRIQKLSKRLLVMEQWRNPKQDVSYFVQAFSDMLRSQQQGQPATNWTEIGVRIALLFASFAQLLRLGEVKLQGALDVAVTAGDFAAPMAVWYAKRMGLPLGKIICGCNDNGGVWDLLYRGEFDADDMAVATETPEADVIVPRNLERLVYGTLGLEEAQRYVKCCTLGKVYFPPEDTRQKLCGDMFAAVISDSRMQAVISGVYSSMEYVLDPYGALAYGSLLDYRSTTGKNRLALLISDCSPQKEKMTVCRLTQMQEAELEKFCI